MAKSFGGPSSDEQRQRQEQTDQLRKLNEHFTVLLAGQKGTSAFVGLVGGAGAGGGGGGALAGLSIPLSGATAAFTTATAVIGHFVQAANPAVMEKFNFVLRDVAGVIGQTLAPVIEALTPAVRLFGDFLASILPSANDMQAALAPLGDLLQDLREALQPIAPIIKDTLVSSLKALGVVLRLLVDNVFKPLFRLLGGSLGEGGPLKSSVGAAAREIRFEDPAAAVKNVYAAAFKAVGTGPGAKPEKTPLDKIQEKIDDVIGWLNKIFGADSAIGQVLRVIGKIVSEIWGVIGKVGGEVLEGIKIAIDNPKLARDALFDKGTSKEKLPPVNVEKAKAANRAARLAGAIQRNVSGKARQGDPFNLADLKRAFLEAMREAGISEKNAQEQLDEVLAEGRRRGMDGHP